jgi:hypothetical protein
VRQPEHLHEIGHRAFAAVILPVGVGDEADGAVEGKVRRHRRLTCRIERQHRLGAHQNVEEEKSTDVEEEHGDRVGQPMLLVLVVNAAKPIQNDFHRSKHWRKQRALAVEDARHVAAERHHQRGNDCAKQDDLKPAGKRHDAPLRTARAEAERR